MTIKLISPDRDGRFRLDLSGCEFFVVVIHGQVVGVLVKKHGA